MLENMNIPKRNQIKLEDGLYAGDIILLWRIAFGTFTNETWFPKYFIENYGIDAQKHLDSLEAKGYIILESAFDSLDHLPMGKKKEILKSIGVVGISKMKVKDADLSLAQNLSEDQLAEYFAVRGYRLSEKGEAALKAHQEIIDRHPKKNL